MIALLQRVTQASVEVSGSLVGQIGQGLLVLVCAQRDDVPEYADKLVDRVLKYRVFADEKGRMNRSLLDLINQEADKPANTDASDRRAGLLLVPQFTLAADTRSGLRPSFTPAATPRDGRALFEHCVERARQTIDNVQTGQFGADMQVSLTNDGPVTFWLQVPA